MYFILGLISLSLRQTVDTEPCTYNAALINTCAEENKTGKRFNIYHTNTLNLTHDTSCSCSITGLKDDHINVAVTNTPGSDNCGSSIHIFKPDSTGFIVTCMSSVATYNIPLTTGKTIKIIFRTTARTFSLSAFCIFVETNMTIKCESRTPILLTSTTTFFSTSKSLPIASTTTEEQKSTKPMTAMTSTKYVTTSNKEETSVTKKETVESSTAGGSGESITTSGDEKMSNPPQHPCKNICANNSVEVIIPAAFGGFIFGVLLTFGVMCFIFRRQNYEIRKQLQTKTQTPVTPHVYDQLAVGNISEHAVYEHIQNTETTTYENAF